MSEQRSMPVGPLPEQNGIAQRAELLMSKCRELENDSDAMSALFVSWRRQWLSPKSPDYIFQDKLEAILSEAQTVRAELQAIQYERGTGIQQQNYVQRIGELCSQEMSLRQGFIATHSQQDEHFLATREKKVEKISERVKSLWPSNHIAGPPVSAREFLTPDESDSRNSPADRQPAETLTSSQTDDTGDAVQDTQIRPQSAIVVKPESSWAADRAPAESSTRKRKLMVTLKVPEKKPQEYPNKKRNNTQKRQYVCTVKKSHDYQEFPSIKEDHTIEFTELYRDGVIKSCCQTIQYPQCSGEFYILHCQRHNLLFRTRAASSINSHAKEEHGLRTWGDVAKQVREFGVRILNCTPALVKEYNAAALPYLMTGNWQNSKVARDEKKDTMAFQSQSRFPPAKRSSGGRPKTRRGIIPVTKPQVGKLYFACWKDRDYAAIVLPFGSFESIGLPGSIMRTGLLGKRRCSSHTRHPTTGEYMWSPGYEDGGILERHREFPIIYFDHDLFPDKASCCWIKAHDLTKFDPDDSSIPHHDAVREYIDQRGDEVFATETDANVSRSIEPSVPAMRNPLNQSPEIDNYFDGLCSSDDEMKHTLSSDSEDEDEDYCDEGDEDSEASETSETSNGENRGRRVFAQPIRSTERAGRQTSSPPIPPYPILPHLTPPRVFLGTKDDPIECDSSDEEGRNQVRRPMQTATNFSRPVKKESYVVATPTDSTTQTPAPINTQAKAGGGSFTHARSASTSAHIFSSAAASLELRDTLPHDVSLPAHSYAHDHSLSRSPED